MFGWFVLVIGGGLCDNVAVCEFVYFDLEEEMANSFSSLCDGFCFDMTVNTELDLPGERDTILTFFERIQRQFPAMGNFYRKDAGDFCLE